MVIASCNQILDTWIHALAHYNSKQLCTKPSQHSWSIGQLYMHLLADTNYYVEQILFCISTNEHEAEEASPFAKTIFFKNAFPDELIEGAPDNSEIQQPVNKEALMRSLWKLKEDMYRIEILISKSSFQGKTKHPGLNYFNAQEWFQFAEIHLRHHLRQKKRIDEFLRLNQ